MQFWYTYFQKRTDFGDCLVGTRRIAPWKNAPSPDPNANHYPKPGGNLLGAVFRGEIFRSPLADTNFHGTIFEETSYMFL